MPTLNSLPTYMDTVEISTEANAKQKQLMEHQFVLQSKTCAGTHVTVTPARALGTDLRQMKLSSL